MIDSLRESTSVLQKVLCENGVLDIASQFPELTNALNDNLDLVKRFTEENTVPAILGPRLWRQLMNSAYQRNGATELQVDIFRVLDETLAEKDMAQIVEIIPECNEALLGNRLLATAIINDGNVAKIIDNSLWRQLVQVMRGPQDEKKIEKSIEDSSAQQHETGFRYVQAWSEEVKRLRSEVLDLVQLVDCAFKDKLSFESAMKFLPIVSQYHMTGLTDKLTDILCESLSLTTCLKIFKLSADMNLLQLNEVAVQCITTNFKLVVDYAPEFLDLTFEDFLLLISSEMVTANEEDILEAVFKWINYESAGRKQHAAPLFKAVRLACLNLETLERIKVELLRFGLDEILTAVECLSELGRSDLACLEKLADENRRLGWEPEKLLGWICPADVIFLMGGRDVYLEDETLIETFMSSQKGWQVQRQTLDPPKGSNVCVAMGRTIFVLEKNGQKIRSFDTMTRAWLNLNPMQVAREEFCLAQNGKTIYALGGKVDLERVSICEAYDREMNTWTRLSHMQLEKSCAAAACFKDRIYCSGGLDGCVNFAITEAFHPSKNNWEYVASMQHPRQAHALIKCGDYLWALGGINMHGALDVVERYNPETDAWMTVSPIPTPRFELSVVSFGKLIYAIGGETSVSNPCDVTEVYNPAQDTWSSGPKIFTPRASMSACVVTSLAKAYSYCTGP